LIGRLGHALGFEKLLDFLGAELLAGLVGGFLQDGVLGDLLGDHLPQFEPVQLQNRNHLDQPRGQDLLLRDP